MKITSGQSELLYFSLELTKVSEMKRDLSRLNTHCYSTAEVATIFPREAK